MAEEKELTIVLKGRNLTGPEFEAARRALAGLSAGAKDAGDKARGSAGGMGLLSSSLGSVGSMARTAIGTMAGFIGAQAVLGALGSAFSFAKDAAFGMNASLEKSTLQFTTLMGDSTRAEAHVRSLFEFAKRTPFETGPIIEASRRMQTFGGDSLNTLANLELLGDAAAATGAPIEDLGFWVGRMYAAIKGGQPFGEASMRLMELGVLTPKTRVEMESLAKSAGGGEKAFKLFQDSLGGFSGAMVAQASTWDGLMSSISDSINITLADALKPFFDTVKTGAQIVLAALGSEGMGRAFESVKTTMSGVFGGDGRSLITGFIDALLAGASGALSALDMIHRVGSGLDVVFATVASGVIRAVESMVGAFAAMSSAAAKMPGTGEAFDDAAESLHRMKDGLTATRTRFDEQARSAVNAARGNSDFSRTLSAGQTVITGFRTELQKAATAQTDVTTATSRAKGPQTESIALTKEQAKAAKETAAEWKKYVEAFNGTKVAEEAGKIVRLVNELRGAHRLTDDAVKQHLGSLMKMIEQYEALGRQAPPDVMALTIQLDQLLLKETDAANAAQLLGQKLETAMTSPRPSIEATIRELERLGKLQFGFENANTKYTPIIPGSVFEGLRVSTGPTMASAILDGMGSTFATKLPGIFQDAFTGGGGISGALKAIGVQIADDVTKPLQEKLAKLGVSTVAAVSAGAAAATAIGGSAAGNTGAMIGGLASSLGGAAVAASAWGTSMAAAGMAGTLALGAATLGIGAAAVGVYMLVKHFTSIPKEVKEARREVDAFQNELAGLLTETQRNEAGNERWKMTIIGVRDALIAVGRSGEDALPLVEALWDTDNPERARAAMAEITAVLIDQQQRLAENRTAANALFDDIIALAGANGGVPAAMQATIDKFVTLGLLTQDQVAKLKGLGEAAEVDFKKMQAASDVFKGRLESLGPAFNQARLDDIARKYTNAIDVMTRGGADLGGVLFDAKEEVSALVVESLQFGTTIPANMRPWIEELDRAGLLLDKDGKKITDLGNLKYGAPLKSEAQIAAEGWQKILDKIDELIGKITGPLQKAVDNIPTQKTLKVDVKYNDPGPPRTVDRDGERNEGFGRGTEGVYGRWMVDFGQERHVRVHGREAIVPEHRAREFAESVVGPSNVDVNVGDTNVIVQVALDPQTGQIRRLTDRDLRQVQQWMDTGQIRVPSRVVTQRSR